MIAHPSRLCGYAIFAIALLTARSTFVDGQVQPAKQPLAKVTVIGKEVGTVATDDGTKKQRYVLLELDAKTKIKVLTSQDVATLPNQLMEQHRKLTQEFADKAKNLIQTNDFEKLKDAEKAFKAASDELLSYLGYYAADGTLTQAGGDLQIEGQLRILTGKEADKSLKKGHARIEGSATQVKGKDGKTSLAIQNGQKVILVTGKAAEEASRATGPLAVYGVLSPGDKGANPVMEAEKIKVSKK